MPGYTRLSVAVLEELSGVAALSAASAGCNLYEQALHDLSRRAVDIQIREQHVIGETGQPRLPQADAKASGTEVRPSTVPGAGLGLFANRTVAVGERIPFFGQFVYHDLHVGARSNGARLRGQIYSGSMVLAPVPGNNGAQLDVHWAASAGTWHSVAVLIKLSSRSYGSYSGGLRLRFVARCVLASFLGYAFGFLRRGQGQRPSPSPPG